jgi:glutamate-1-semialdehyde 2,1-aminomutase
MNLSNSIALQQRALLSIPGGVSSPVRAFHAVGGNPRYIASAKGSKITDADGNSYVDLIGSWGPMILGHAHPVVVSKVAAALEDSFSFGAPTKKEILLAEEVLKRVPAAERVRFVSSGTEAVMTAVRLARAATSRNLIVKFAGCYHGHSDALLVEAGSGVATLGLPNSPGVTLGQTKDTIVLDYNDEAALKELFQTRGHEIAAVLTEATPANMGVVPPNPGFNLLIRDLTTKHGALFVLDEVMTGFRISAGGWWGKFGRLEGWEPDLFTFGKVIGGGFPLAAVAGKARIMDQLAPAGPVYQAGTLSGNPVAATAGLETLALCDEALYEKLDGLSERLGQGISDILTEHGIRHAYQHAGNLFSFFFGVDRVENYAQAKTQSQPAFGEFFKAMLDNGVMIPPSAFEAWFVSNALSDEDEAQILAASYQAAKAVAATSLT